MTSQKIKIAFVSSHISNSLQFVWFQEELKRKDIQHIHIIINNSKEPIVLAEDLIKLGLPTFVLSYKNSFSLVNLFFQIRKILKSQKINVVHTTLPYGNLLGQLSAISLGINARVTTCENASWAYDYKSKKQWLIDKFTFLSSKKVISVADTANDFLLNTWRIPKNKLVQINHALILDRYTNISTQRINAIRNLLDVDENTFVIGMIARTEFWKGHEYAVQAMATIVKKYKNIKLFICGSIGFDHQKLIDLIKQNQLQDNVKFIGFVADSIAFLKFVKIQVHVPINKYVENCGISIIEGMAAKVPQILTLSGYAFQSANHLKNAYVVDYCNANQIADGIEFLYLNYDKAIILGEQAFKDAEKEYTIPHKYERHMKVYEEILN